MGRGLRGCWSGPNRKWRQSASGDGEKEVDSKYILNIESISLAAGHERDLRGRGKSKDDLGVWPE